MKDGGPAFPITDVHQPWDRSSNSFDGVQTDVVSTGMSLRDWFAGQALTGLIRSYAQGDATEWANVIAKYAYAFADALVKEREKNL